MNIKLKQPETWADYYKSIDNNFVALFKKIEEMQIWQMDIDMTLNQIPFKEIEELRKRVEALETNKGE